MNKIMIGTPMYGGQCHIYYVKSVIDLVASGLSLEFAFVSNESLITRARNTIADTFLKSDCTHLFFIDSDIGFKAEDVRRFLEFKNLAVACGLYPVKSLSGERVGLAIDGSKNTNVINNSEFATPIKAGGTGFMLIKREVLEVLAEKAQKYYYNGKEHAEIFRCYIHEGQYLSEDYAFCKDASDLGFMIWALPADLSHTGTHTFR